MSKDEIKESSEYENCLDLLDEKPSEQKDKFKELFEFETSDDDNWEKHWRGMPEFEQDDNSPWKTLKVHFKSEEDYKEFSKLIGQSLSNKTKSTWHPKQDITKNALFRWVEE